jgi:hypothetical protein
MSYIWALLFLKWNVMPGLDDLAEFGLGDLKIYRYLRGGEWWHYQDYPGSRFSFEHWSRQGPGCMIFSKEIGYENWS